MGVRSWRALMWICLSVLFALSLWFSASVVAQEIIELWHIQPKFEAWLSASIPIGFVTGAFVSAYFGLADRFNVRYIFALSATAGALFNGVIIFVDEAAIGIVLRILTGASLAGVYPVAVKMLSEWFPKKRGVAIGILIASLTVGTSLPHVVTIFLASFPWQGVIMSSSVLAIIAACIVYFIVEDAPGVAKSPPFSFTMLHKVITNKQAMLVNYGYFGHNWELYAMWTWLPTFLSASFLSYQADVSASFVSFISFAVIGLAGSIGCVIGGIVADKIGRAHLTMLSMTISGTCALLIGFTYGEVMWLTILLALVWGMSIIADSAQFSAAVSEVVEPEYVGTAVTFQMCIGFLITIISINLVPILEQQFGWQSVFAFLAIGPLLGTLAMYQFRKYEVKNNNVLLGRSERGGK